MQEEKIEHTEEENGKKDQEGNGGLGSLFGHLSDDDSEPEQYKDSTTAKREHGDRPFDLNTPALSSNSTSTHSHHGSPPPRPPRRIDVIPDGDLSGRVGDVEQQINPLGYLLTHHMTRTPSFGLKDAAIWGAAVIVTAGSLVLYINPTRDFAGDEVSHQILYIGSTIGANAGVGLYTSSEGLKSLINNLPLHVRNIINPNYHTHRGLIVLKVGGLAALAIINSLPYAFTAEGNEVEKAIVAASNTVMNYYGLNNLIFEHAKFIKNKFTFSRQKRAYQHLVATFTHVTDEITREIIKTGVVPNEFTGDMRLDAKQMLQFLAGKAAEFDIQPYKPLSTTGIVTRRLVPTALGAGLVSGLSVYLLKTYELFAKYSDNKLFNFTATSTISAVFYYVAVSFSAKTMIDIFDILSCNKKKSLAMQLYPIPTVAAMIAILAGVSLSFAAIGDFILNDKYFQDGEALSPGKQAALVIAAISAVIFNNFPNQKLGAMVIESIARRIGSKKDLANFGIEMRKFLENVNGAMSPEAFLRSLGDLTEEEKLALLPMHNVHDSLDELINIASGREPVRSDHQSFYKNFSVATRYALGQATLHGEEEIDMSREGLNELKRRYGAEEEVPLAAPPGCLTRFWNSLPSVNLQNPFRRRDYDDVIEAVDDSSISYNGT